MTAAEPARAGPRLSVVVPTYRDEPRLAALLDSLAAQSFDPAAAEVVVVDDGTPGFQAADWERRGGALAVTVIHFDHNCGRATARNAGIRAARGDIVIFLDGDMTAAPGFLAAHDTFHQRQPGAMAVGGIIWAPGVPERAVTRYAAGRGVARWPAGPVPGPRAYKCFVTGNSSVPRDRLLEVGGFDESLSTYGGEDLELGYRLHRAGLRLHHLPEAVSLHHGWRDLDSMLAAMATYGAGSLPQLVARHPELTEVLRLDFLTLPRLHPRRLALGLALWGPLQAAAKGTTRRLVDRVPLPGLLFDYLWWSERTRAFLRSSGTASGALAGPGAGRS